MTTNFCMQGINLLSCALAPLERFGYFQQLGIVERVLASKIRSSLGKYSSREVIPTNRALSKIEVRASYFFLALKLREKGDGRVKGR